MLRYVPRPVLAIAASFFLASCLCNTWQAPSCDLSLSLWGSCDLDASVPNGTLRPGLLGSCWVECSPGWDDCDGDPSNGCEHVGMCPVGKDGGADAGSAAELLGTLPDAPVGLAVCDDHVYVVGGDRIVDVHGDGGSSDLTLLPTPAAGGIACRGGELYLGLKSAGILPGTLIRRDVDGSVSELAANVEPGRGIDVDDAGTVLWPSIGDAGSVLTRTDPDGSTALGPVDDSPVAWPFSRGAGGLYTVTSGALVALSGDAQAPIPGPDASLLAVAVDDGVSVLAQEDASTSFHVLEDGGIGASLTELPSARAMVRYGIDTYVATDTTIVRLADDGTKVTLMTDQLHIVDMVVLGAWVYWTTLGDGSTPASVYRAKR